MSWLKRLGGAPDQVPAHAPSATVSRPSDLLPKAELDAARDKAFAMAQTGQLSSEAEVEQFMRKVGVKHIADRAEINDAIFKAQGMY